jgi:ABC-type glycerol-3-phosphate transport system substrate-binding protein
MGEKELKNPTYTDEDGNEVESQDYAWINGVDIPIEPMTEEELAKFKEVMYSFTQVYHYDTDLVQIIEEEAEAFFNGQKSAEDVAAIIQSRAQIYVQENR